MLQIFKSKASGSGKEHPVLNAVTTVLSGILVCIALAVTPGWINIDTNYGTGLEAVSRLFHAELTTPSLGTSLLAIGWIVLDWQLKQKQDLKKTRVPAAVLGAIFSVFLVLGRSFAAFHDFTFIAFRLEQVPIALLTAWGFYLLFRDILHLIFGYLDNRKRKEPRVLTGRGAVLFRDHIVLCSFCIMLICWIIFSLPWFPANLPHDGRYQLNIIYKDQVADQHHPVLSTAVLGGIHYLGSLIGGYNFGAFLVVAVQFLLAAWIFSRTIGYISSRNRFELAVAALVFYALCPVWWTYLQTIMKDTLFFILFTWFGLTSVEVLEGRERKWLTVEWILASVLVCLFRHNGIYIVIPMLIAGLIVVFRQVRMRKQIIAGLCAVIVCFAGSSLVVNNILHIRPGKRLEAYSVPLQGFARYVIVHQEEITDEEIETIERVLQYDGIEERYLPEFADRIKDRYNPKMTSEDFKAFWSLYLQYAAKDPLTFIEGIYNHIFGYTDPEYIYDGMAKYQLYIKDSLNSADPGRVYASYVMPEEWRTSSSRYVNGWHDIPVLSLLVNPSAYTWLYLFMIVQALRKKHKRKLVLYLAPLLSILICFVSPVNGLLRYALPVMAVMPLFIFLLLRDDDLEGETV